MIVEYAAVIGVSKIKRELMYEFSGTENSLVIRFKTMIPMFAPGDSQILLTAERQNLKYFREINNSAEFLRPAKKLSVLY